MSASEYGTGTSPGSTRSSTKVAVSPARSVDARADVAAVDDLERAARREAERQLGRAEERAVRGERDLVAGARVVEARGDVDDEAHPPAHGEHPADHAVAWRRLAGARRGHEVLHLPHPSGVRKRVMRMLVSGR